MESSDLKVFKIAITLWFTRWNGPMCVSAVLNYDAFYDELVKNISKIWCRTIVLSTMDYYYELERHMVKITV